MKTKLFMAASATLLIAALTACSPKPAATDTTASSIAPPTEMAPMSAGSDMSGMTMDTDASGKIGTGNGVVTEIDKTAGTVTIKHDAIPAVDWPAMTMAFKANPSSLLDKVKVGQKVTFGVSVKGSDAEVTSIQ